MNGRALCFLQAVLLGFREGAIQSRSAASKQNPTTSLEVEVL